MFFILGFTPSDTETVLEVVDAFHYIYTYLVGGVSFFRARISPKILFWVNIEYPVAGGIRVWILTRADTPRLSGLFIVFPYHFQVYKLHGGKPATQMRLAFFSLHLDGKDLLNRRGFHVHSKDSSQSEERFSC